MASELHLSDKQYRIVVSVATQVSSGDLYTALHHVGDDPTKSNIEDALKIILPDEAFRRVVAVFKIMTEDNPDHQEFFGE
jgi:hypothetical protein